MLLGVISDTHNYLGGIDKAFKHFSDEKVVRVIHAGDWTSIETVQYVSTKALETDMKVFGVIGNNDATLINSIQKDENIAPNTVISKERILSMSVSGYKIVVYHGTEADLLLQLVTSGQYDAVITGHTHTKMIEQIGNTLLINPGSSSTPLAHLKGQDSSVCVLDTENAEVTFKSLED